jgi:hypothetical protein
MHTHCGIPPPTHFSHAGMHLKIVRTALALGRVFRYFANAPLNALKAHLTPPGSSIPVQSNEVAIGHRCKDKTRICSVQPLQQTKTKTTGRIQRHSAHTASTTSKKNSNFKLERRCPRQVTPSIRLTRFTVVHSRRRVLAVVAPAQRQLANDLVDGAAVVAVAVIVGMCIVARRAPAQRPARWASGGVWCPRAANERSEPIVQRAAPRATRAACRRRRPSQCPTERDLGLRFDKSRRARSRRWPQFGRTLPIEQLRRHVDRRAFEAGPVDRRHLHDAGLVVALGDAR